MTYELGTSTTELEAHFRNLGGLAGSSFARDDDHLVVRDRLHDLFTPLADRQLIRKANGTNGAHGA